MLHFYFFLSEFACGLSLLVFYKVVCRNIKRSLFTVPALAFSGLYFVGVPAVNVLTGRYVDERIFIEDPFVSLSLLNLFNAALILVAAAGARLLPTAAPTEEPAPGADRPPRLVIQVLVVLLFLQVIYGTLTIYIGRDVLIAASGELFIRGTIAQYAFIESAPLTFCWIVVLLFYNRKPPRPTVVAAIFVVQLLLTVALAGSRGSRVAMLSQLLFSIQLYGATIYRFRFRDFAFMALGCALFLPIYANYKYGGIDALNDYVSGRGESAAARVYNDPVMFVVGDLGRADIQAPLLSRALAGRFTPNYYGDTYLSALDLFLPQPARPGWIRPKVELGAIAQIDRDEVPSGYRGVLISDGDLQSSRIYGLFGEAILNFGLYGLPVAFLIFGLAHRAAFRWLTRPRTWRRLLFSPYVAVIPIYLLFYDSDNLIVQTVSVWIVPSIAVFCAAAISPRLKRPTMLAHVRAR